MSLDSSCLINAGLEACYLISEQRASYLNCATQNPTNRTVSLTPLKSEISSGKRHKPRSLFHWGLLQLMLNKIQEPVETIDELEQKPKYRPGNEADFQRLYETSYGKILGTLTAMLGDRAAAEDCAQDAFERAYRKWSTWQPIAPAEAWVHRIAIK